MYHINVYSLSHLASTVQGFLSREVSLLGGFWPRVFCPGVCPGGLCPRISQGMGCA